ncbi:MAG TPA: glycosyltransferase family 2 protein [Euryarchaeota archaeon]|nr:glycosyltransferase family 2 protein [Euryarchaeota archaeon]
MEFWTFVEAFVIAFNVLILFYFATLNLFYISLSIMASYQLFRFRMRLISRHRDMHKVPVLPSVSVLSPAFNEEVTIAESLRSQLNLDYPNLEVIVINDGSRDNTLKVLKKEFKLVKTKRRPNERIPTQRVKTVYRSKVHKNLYVLDKENGGKADALNAGVNFSRSKLFCAIDADSLLEKRALLRLVEEYLVEGGNIIALGGIIRIANDCRIKDGEVLEARLPRKFLPAIQAVEYIRAFLCGRSGFNMINALLIISGAFGLFDRRTVIEVGGYRTDTVGEDMELVVRLHRKMREWKREYKVLFIPDPVCWTQAPDEWKVLRNQRNRWQRGLIESLMLNKQLMLNPRYGMVGTISMPFFFFFEAAGPIFEIMGYVIVLISTLMGWINVTFFFVFLFLAIVMGIILTLSALILEEATVKKYNNPRDLFFLVLLSFAENLGYRQIITYWRLKGIIDLVKRKRSWGKMVRKKFS